MKITEAYLKDRTLTTLRRFLRDLRPDRQYPKVMTRADYTRALLGIPELRTPTARLTLRKDRLALIQIPTETVWVKTKTRIA